MNEYRCIVPPQQTPDLPVVKIVDRGHMKRKSSIVIDRLGAEFSPISRPVGSFSGGQPQSVAIACALTFDPKIVILDEPTAALAVCEVQSVLDLKRKLKTQGISAILCSHHFYDTVLSALTASTGKVQCMFLDDRLISHREVFEGTLYGR